MKKQFYNRKNTRWFCSESQTVRESFFLWSQIVISSTIRNGKLSSLREFKAKINTWPADHCPCRICKNMLGNKTCTPTQKHLWLWFWLWLWFSFKNLQPRKVVSSLDLDVFFSYNSILPCYCADLCFIDRDHGHILAGDLEIFNNNKPTSRFTKGPKYTESMSVILKGARFELILSRNNFIDN